jgi:hypothetical protein
MRWSLILALLLWPTLSHAQVIDLAGGNSTVMDAVGGEATIYLPNSETQIGYGLMDGRPIFGMTERTRVAGFNLVGGDTTLPAALPSDFSGGSFGFYARGVSAERDRIGEDKLLVFAGETSQFYGFPMTFGSKTTGDYMSMVSYERTLSEHWTFDSFEVVAARQTALQSIDWHPSRDTHAAISAGIGSNARYFGILFDTRKKYYAAKIGYTNSGSDFRLLQTPNALLIQNSGLSGQGGLTPTKWLGFTGSQIHYQTPIGNTSLRSTVDNFGTYLSFSVVDFHAGDYRGSTAGQRTGGQEFGASVHLPGDLISILSDYSTSQYGHILLNTVSERISRKIRISQYINTTARGTTVNVGGSYSGNAISVNVSYAQEFFPFAAGKNPFSTTLNASVSFHIKNASVTVATLTSPGGGTRYTAYANSYLYGPIQTTESGHRSRSLGGKFIVAGVVTLADGSPVQGAAIVISDAKGRSSLVWSDSAGKFEARVKSAQEYAVAVSLDDFTAPEIYVVRECPATAKPGPEGRSETIHVVLLRQ